MSGVERVIGVGVNAAIRERRANGRVPTFQVAQKKRQSSPQPHAQITEGPLSSLLTSHSSPQSSFTCKHTLLLLVVVFAAEEVISGLFRS